MDRPAPHVAEYVVWSERTNADAMGGGLQTNSTYLQQDFGTIIHFLPCKASVGATQHDSPELYGFFAFSFPKLVTDVLGSKVETQK